MARLTDQEYTYVNDRDIVGSGLATSPTGVAFIRDVQRALYEDQPADTAAAEQAAAAADTKAQGALTAADAAQFSADDAATRADTAQNRADAAYALAAGKVTKAVISTSQNYAGSASATYSQAEVQGLMDKVASLTGTVQAIVAALKQ